MKWTSEKPTKPGWYWWRPDNDGFCEVAVVERVGNGLWFSRWGAAAPMRCTDSVGQWAGPLEEPQE